MSRPLILNFEFKIFEAYTSLSGKRNLRLFDLKYYTQMLIYWEYNKVYSWCCDWSNKSRAVDILARKLVFLFELKIPILN